MSILVVLLLEFFPEVEMKYWFFVFLLLFFGVMFMVTYTIMNNFIYSKIKLIYKTVHNLRKADDDIDFASGQFLKQFNKEVISWSQEQKEEINSLKTRENFRREYVGNLAHELRTPLTVAQGNVQTLFEGAIDNPDLSRKFLERAAKGIDRMIALVQDMHSITTLEAGIIKLEYSTFDIVKLTENVYEELSEKAKDKKVKLNIVKSGNKPIMVTADKTRIEQVMVNLVSNAINYSKKEGGKVETRFYGFMDHSYLVEVADDGIGMESKDLSRIFERFYRVDKSRSRNTAGSGLGLAICKHILEAHDSRINVRSTKDIGSTFSFTLKKA